MVCKGVRECPVWFHRSTKPFTLSQPPPPTPLHRQNAQTARSNGRGFRPRSRARGAHTCGRSSRRSCPSAARARRMRRPPRAPQSRTYGANGRGRGHPRWHRCIQGESDRQKERFRRERDPWRRPGDGVTLVATSLHACSSRPAREAAPTPSPAHAGADGALGHRLRQLEQGARDAHFSSSVNRH